MPRTLLISDANILIDIDVGGVLREMFALAYEFGVPNVLYEQELKLRHPEMHELGLRSIELSANSVAKVISLVAKYRSVGVSTNDVFALVLAQQEQTTLLTGDAKLRQVCIAENVDVHGTVWLMGEMLAADVLDVDRARAAYEAMRRAGSRLPWQEIEKQLKDFES